MARDISPKCKQCRRAAEKLFLKGERCLTTKCAIVKKNYPPGFHGPKGKTRQTDYGLQLNEKQKAKRQYALLEKQFKLTFLKAQKRSGNTGENFLQMLETRLDNTVFRLGLAASRNQARQLVNHGLITVNDKKVTIPSYQVKTGDKIKIKDNKARAGIFKNLDERMKNIDIPGWLNIDRKALTGKVLHAPSMDDINTNINIQMIIEFYSR